MTYLKIESHFRIEYKTYSNFHYVPLSPGPLQWSSPLKEDQMLSEFRLVGSKIVKRLRRRKYDPVII